MKINLEINSPKLYHTQCHAKLRETSSSPPPHRHNYATN